MTAKAMAVYSLSIACMLGFQNCQKSDLLSANVDSSRGPASEGFAHRIDFSSDIARANSDQLKLRAENRKLGDEAIRQAQLGIRVENTEKPVVNAVDPREPTVIVPKR